MRTKVIPEGTQAITAVLDAFSKHEPAVVPTETVYGLAAPISSEQAVKKIYAIKGRPEDNPLIVHINSYEQLLALTTHLPAYTKKLFDAFWPGPLTIVAQAKQSHPTVTAGRDTIAVRMPAHPFMQSLIQQAGPIAAPSANTSGKPSPTTAKHCLDDLEGRVQLIVDGGEGFHGVESTVLDVSEDHPAILRPGVITQDMIEDVIKRPCNVKKISEAKSPGIKYAHYQPDARVILTNDPQSADVQDSRVLVVSKKQPSYAHTHIPLPENQTLIAKNVYSWLRRADEEGFDAIVIQTVPDAGLGAAVMDRLRRAAKHS